MSDSEKKTAWLRSWATKFIEEMGGPWNGEKHHLEEGIKAIAPLLDAFAGTVPEEFREGGWLADGVMAVCPECKQVKEGTIGWHIEHEKTCKWKPAGTWFTERLKNEYAPQLASMRAVTIAETVAWLRTGKSMAEYDGISQCQYNEAVFPSDLADALESGVLDKDKPKTRDAWASDDDEPLPEDEEIDKAFPTESGRHDLYGRAMRLVGAKVTKGGLVSLVTWLLLCAEPKAEEERKKVCRCPPPKLPLTDTKNFRIGCTWHCDCGASYLLALDDKLQRAWEKTT